jgi:hypothetical protein
MAKAKLILAVILLIAAPVLSYAQDSAPKWSYIEAGYVDFDPDSGLSDDGWFAGGSLNILKNFHLLAEYNDIGDYTLWNAGIGWHGLFGDPGDLFAQVVWNDVEVDSSSFSDDGYGASAGVRWMLVDWFEVKGQINWIDLDQSGSDTTTEVGALFSFLKNRFAFGAEYETGDADTLRAFFRINFGK